MPPAKKRATRATGKRTMTAAHKQALAEGRTMPATVNAYLEAINTPKRRGRKVTTATLEQRLVKAQTSAKDASGIEKVVVAQEIRDLKAKIAQATAATPRDLKALEGAFVKIAKRFGEKRGVTYGAWRDAGVPAVVLKQAGVARTRG
jgi:hypothetical protein